LIGDSSSALLSLRVLYMLLLLIAVWHCVVLCHRSDITLLTMQCPVVTRGT